ncbi:VWFA and cache domain-containing protein CG16868 [Eumeta japonica]|uniref:VWFA and cache domain-containing protein CG16868 n=1 Tax=Eumeta variegata TaxID=151549 RepID=A0A4C1SBU3_EUMVA|nr:VWFA and cache domain-containing protein CG16868 [Eumeta japonica]
MKFLLLLFIITTFVNTAKFAASQNESSFKGNRCDNKISVRTLSDLLSNKFHEVVVNELGSEYTAHLEPRTSYRVIRSQYNDQEVLKNIGEKLAYKLSSAAIILRDMKNVIASSSNTPSFMHPCPFTSIRKSGFIKNSNDLSTSETKAKLTRTFKDVKVKRQYFLSHIDHATDKDCSSTSLSNLRSLYHKVVHPEPKLVVFILDNTIGVDSFQYAVNVVLEIANALQSKDMITLKITNSSDFIKFEDTCSIDGMSDVGNATDNNKILLREYLAAIDTSLATFSISEICNELKFLLEKPNLPQHKLLIFLTDTNYLYDMSDGQEALTYMQNYLAYLKSVAHGLLSNPGLKNEIQHDVGFLNSVLSYYTHQHLHGAYSQYVIRRYAVTESGVMVMFPGTVLEYDYEPVRRPWYTYAIDNPGKIILTPPNLDVGGAGYIVSISYAVKRKHFPIMVVAMDVTMGFLYKLLIDSLPLCALSYMKCFIMNNRGYLVSHPGLMDPNSSGPIEQQHITHKESMIAIDMLNHKGFVRKRLCNNFSDKTIQRFYEFNISLSNVLSNVVSGDHCVHYYIASIPGTNTFVGLVNASCSVGAFCPCSMVDRLCLNCNRMEQNECECPCECSSEAYHCPKSNLSRSYQDLPLCGVIPESNHHKSHYFNNYAENLKPCFDFQCEIYTTHSSCLGVMGCEWCQLDTDGHTPLSSPFCTAQPTCFSGVLGAVTPYGEGTYGHVSRDDVLGSYSTIGPIAGCIVTVSLVIAVAIYCYRQNVTSTSCHNLYVDGPAETWPEQDVQLSHLQSDDANGDHSGHDKLLPAAEIEAPISPYRVVTGYRRPHTTGDSDHGYSTMTPHEDSEATAFSMNEPIVLSDDTKSDVSCPIPSKIKPRPRPGETNVIILPCSKNIINAPVTVHRQMEAS